MKTENWLCNHIMKKLSKKCQQITNMYIMEKDHQIIKHVSLNLQMIHSGEKHTTCIATENSESVKTTFVSY